VWLSTGQRDCAVTQPRRKGVDVCQLGCKKRIATITELRWRGKPLMLCDLDH